MLHDCLLGKLICEFGRHEGKAGVVAYLLDSWIVGVGRYEKVLGKMVITY